jgi:hypothetical protein
MGEWGRDALISIKRIADLMILVVFLTQIQHDGGPFENPLFALLNPHTRLLGRAVDDRWDAAVGYDPVSAIPKPFPNLTRAIQANFNSRHGIPQPEKPMVRYIYV